MQKQESRGVFGAGFAIKDVQIFERSGETYRRDPQRLADAAGRP